MKFRKFRKNVKAISPVISVLLMIAVAVVASLVAYAWVMGYIGFQTAKTGQAVQIQSVAFGTADQSGNRAVSNVYVQNVGDGSITIVPAQCLYVNGQLDTGAAASLTNVGKGDTTTITAGSGQLTFAPGTIITVKVTTEGGTYSQISQVVPEALT
jgi:flagellin-like protein